MGRMLRQPALAVVLLAVLLAGGCAAGPKPFDYSAVDEVKPGPGLLSGDDGVFTIYGEPGTASPDQDDAAPEVEKKGQHRLQIE